MKFFNHKTKSFSLCLFIYASVYFCRYYKTLSLWLEEPRLQEAGLYLPALPPQYMSQKLILIMQNDEVKIILFYGST